MINQNNIAGIGNVYVQDILFKAKLHPNRKISTLTEKEINDLYNAVQDLLNHSIQPGGLAYEKDFYGQKGRLTINEFLVGYKTGKPCPVCKTPIEKNQNRNNVLLHLPKMSSPKTTLNYNIRSPNNIIKERCMMMIEKVSWLEVKVTDMKQAIAFYRDTLELKIKKEWPYYVIFDLPGTITFAIMLGGKKGRKEGAPNIYFTVENVDKEYEKLKKKA